jgi:hypothetical protein
MKRLILVLAPCLMLSCAATGPSEEKMSARERGQRETDLDRIDRMSREERDAKASGHKFTTFPRSLDP